MGRIDGTAYWADPNGGDSYSGANLQNNPSITLFFASDARPTVVRGKLRYYAVCTRPSDFLFA